MAILNKPRDIPELAAVVTVSAGIATGFAIAVEVIGRMVLLIPSTIRRIRQEGVQQGLKQGNQRWKAWLERKEAAEAAGLPFNEPSPADRQTTDA